MPKYTQVLLTKHPLLFCFIVSSSFSVTMYVGSIFSLQFKATNLLAISLAGAVFGLIIAIEILIIKTQRKLKICQLCTGAVGGFITGLCIQTSIMAGGFGASIGLLLAITANKRLYSTQ